MLLPSYLIAVSFQQIPTTKLCNCNSGSQIISGNERGDTLSSLVNVSKKKKCILGKCLWVHGSSQYENSGLTFNLHNL